MSGYETSPVTILDDEESWGLLRSRSFGRLALTVAGRPEIFPVNYAVEDETLVMRTAPGTKLATLTVNNAVALETDEVGEDEAWSVVVKGIATVHDSEEDFERADGVGLFPQVPTEKNVLVRIRPSALSGRRFRLATRP